MQTEPVDVHSFKNIDRETVGHLVDSRHLSPETKVLFSFGLFDVYFTCWMTWITDNPEDMFGSG